MFYFTLWVGFLSSFRFLQTDISTRTTYSKDTFRWMPYFGGSHPPKEKQHKPWFAEVKNRQIKGSAEGGYGGR
jgi:hypothetical protein